MGKKVPFWHFYQKSADWLDWPCLVSAALHNLLTFKFFKYETIVRSSAWSFGHSDPDPSSVNSVVFSKQFGWLKMCENSEFVTVMWLAAH